MDFLANSIMSKRQRTINIVRTVNSADRRRLTVADMFKESDTLDSISDHKMGILIIESDLRDHLKEICKQLKRKTIDFVTVAGIEFLIELKNDATKLVPREWVCTISTRVHETADRSID